VSIGLNIEVIDNELASLQQERISRVWMKCVLKKQGYTIRADAAAFERRNHDKNTRIIL